LVVSADGTTNLTLTAFAPANPGGPTLTTVYGWLLDSGGAARSGVTVAVQPVLEAGEVLRPYGVSSVTKLLSRYSRNVVTDSTGYFEVLLTPNDLITPAGTKYAVTFSDTPTDRALVTVASGGPINFYSLL
ncbi:MAG: hypothetical protein IT377_12165, partial [Polyangiaceae bacterium]|nr:hypothetical protein [Polyangiaceae bacterium]